MSGEVRTLRKSGSLYPNSACGVCLATRTRARVEHRPARLVERVAQKDVGRVEDLVRVIRVAAVHLEAVDAPRRVGGRVDRHVARQRAKLVLALARVLAARLRAHVIVRAQLEAFAVNIVGERLHARGEADCRVLIKISQHGSLAPATGRARIACTILETMVAGYALKTRRGRAGWRR